MSHRMELPVRDWDDLRHYVRTGSGEAFARVVAAHVDMVYSTSRRVVGDPATAEDVTQAVFLILARKAADLPDGTVLAAWLHKAARYTALNALKAAARRRGYERRAAEMNSEVQPPAGGATWHRLAPHLDEGLARLRDKDRAAVVLRFFQQRSLAEVGAALGVSEAAAQMRVARALEKLRQFFAGRGIAVPAAAIGGVAAVNAVHAAPPGLGHASAAAAAAAGSAGATAVGGSSAGTASSGTASAAPAGADSVSALADGGARAMAWANTRWTAAVTGGTAAAVALVVLSLWGAFALWSARSSPVAPPPATEDRVVRHEPATDSAAAPKAVTDADHARALGPVGLR